MIYFFIKNLQALKIANLDKKILIFIKMLIIYIRISSSYIL